VIPADHFLDNGDGTAWVVGTEEERTPGVYPDGDTARSCDTCGGNQRIDLPDYRNAECPDCDGTGRHTFMIEVERTCPGGGDLCGGDDPHTLMPPRTHRVSVVEGMVLPIVGKWEHRPNVGSFITRFDGATRLWTDADLYEHLRLPPDAKPGMWAVKLQVHQ
jgi:hypothetical protein